MLPEEIFFHSIVEHLYRNEPDRIAPKVTFVNWGTNNSSGPSNLRLQDPECLCALKPGYLFARKFDAALDSAILNALDARTGAHAE